MNKARRAQIRKVINAIEELKSSIELIRDEEQDALDNMPESLWESERYERMECAVDTLDDAIDELDNAMENLEEAAE